MNNSRHSVGVLGIITALSGLATITTFIIKVVNGLSGQISIVVFLGAGITCILLIAFLLKKYPKLRYFLLKQIRYLFHFSEPYCIEKQISEYTIIDKNKMKHYKEHQIKSNIAQLDSFSDKFKWSKPQSEEETEEMMNRVEQNSTTNHVIKTARFENWIRYTALIDNLAKGETTTIGVIIDNLFDPNQQSLPFLSGHATVKTKCLNLKVIFEDGNLTINRGKYKIYNDYASDYPIISKDIRLEACDGCNHRCFEINEYKPIPGYRYVISWEY